MPQALGDEQIAFGIDARQHPAGIGDPQFTLGMPAIDGLEIPQLGKHLAHGVEKTGDGAGSVLHSSLETVDINGCAHPLASHTGMLLPFGARMAGMRAHLVTQLLQMHGGLLAVSSLTTTLDPGLVHIS